MKKTISMVLYGEDGRVADAALGDYPQRDVEVFLRDGYVPVNRRKADRFLAGRVERSLDYNSGLNC